MIISLTFAFCVKCSQHYTKYRRGRGSTTVSESFHKFDLFLQIYWYPTYSSPYCLMLQTATLDEAKNIGDLIKGNHKVRMKPFPSMHNWSPIGNDWMIDSHNAYSVYLTVLYPTVKCREYTTQRRYVLFTFLLNKNDSSGQGIYNAKYSQALLFSNTVQGSGIICRHSEDLEFSTYFNFKGKKERKTLLRVTSKTNNWTLGKPSEEKICFCSEFFQTALTPPVFTEHFEELF